MNPGPASSSKLLNTSGTVPHLVVKRGHHGRFRFVMLSDGEKIAGEVRVDLADSVQNGPRSLALARIAKLAEALLAGVTTHPAIDEVGAGNRDDPTCADPTDAWLHTIVGEGNHHGQI